MMERYSRQIKSIGLANQNTLNGSTVLVVGCGGIGSPLLLYLTSIGIGRIIFYDGDVVELTNLHRQVLFKEDSLSKNKAIETRKELISRNSEVELIAIDKHFSLENYIEYIEEVDLIIDASDNFETTYFINDVCCKHNKKFVSCSIQEALIQIVAYNTTFNCHRCMFPESPPHDMSPSCTEAGVLGTVTGIAGTFTANMVVDIILENNESVFENILVIDTKKFEVLSFPLKKNNQCNICQKGEFEFLDLEKYSISYEEMNKNEYFIVDVREIDERNNFKLEDDAHIPVDKLAESSLKNIQSKVILYCHSDKRSKKGVALLRKKGIEAFYLKGGVSPWIYTPIQLH